MGGGRSDDDELRRVEDLAKGLSALHEADPHHVGPEMVHYRHVAASLAEVLARAEDG